MDIIHLLNSLDEEQVILEATYLKATIAKEIKLKKRVKDLDTAKFRMVKLPLEQIKQSILNVINPMNDVSDDVDNLLVLYLFFCVILYFNKNLDLKLCIFYQFIIDISN